MCDDVKFLENDNALSRLTKGGILLVQSDSHAEDFWAALSITARQKITDKEISAYIVNARTLANHYVIEEFKISGWHTCFWH